MPTSERDAREVVVTEEMVAAGEAEYFDKPHRDDGTAMAAVYRAMRALEPAPSGEWTREPPTEAGWYWTKFIEGTQIQPLWLNPGYEGVGGRWLRWSLPIPLPPAPTDEVK